MQQDLRLDFKHEYFPLVLLLMVGCYESVRTTALAVDCVAFKTYEGTLAIFECEDSLLYDIAVSSVESIDSVVGKTFQV